MRRASIAAPAPTWRIWRILLAATGEPPRVKRWLIAMLGLALAAGAIIALVSGRGPRGAGTTREQEPPHGEIDDASRAELERVLREATHESGSPERRK